MTCVWSGTEKRSGDELRQCYTTMVEDMESAIWKEPDSVEKTKSTWNTNHYKIEIGKGKFENYTGSDNSTIAIIITAISIPKPTQQPGHSWKQSPTKTPKPTKSATLGESNALTTALSYLDYSAFSRKGLIEQLVFEGYSTSEAEYAVNACGANWNEQAARMAKSYMEYSSFSKKGLIEQLEFEGFTHEQALYGVKKIGY